MVVTALFEIILLSLIYTLLLSKEESSTMLEVFGMMHYLDANKTAGEEARWQLHKNVASNIEQVLAATPNKAPTIRPPSSHYENYPS